MGIFRRMMDWLRGGAAQAPGHTPETSQSGRPRPLTPAESEPITKLEVWDLWYFNYAPGSRDSHRIAVCFRREQAEAIVRERGGTMATREPGSKGYHVHGPISLIELYPETPEEPDHPVRVALDRLERGDDSPILLKYYTLAPAERALLEEVQVWDLWYEDTSARTATRSGSRTASTKNRRESSSASAAAACSSPASTAA